MQNNIFSCEYCDFTTKRKYNLQRHQNALHISNNSNFDNEENAIQNEENAIQSINERLNCTKCNKNYKTKKYLINHEKNCIGINSLTCPRCMTLFSSTGNKSKHIKKNNCKAKSIIHSSNNNNITPNINFNGNNNNNINNTSNHNNKNNRNRHNKKKNKTNKHKKKVVMMAMMMMMTTDDDDDDDA